MDRELLRQYLHLPPQHFIDDAQKCQCDSFYALPNYVECFIDRANGELGAAGLKTYVRPYTLNRSVTAFFPNGAVSAITYEVLEDGGLVWALDRLKEEALIQEGKST